MNVMKVHIKKQFRLDNMSQILGKCKFFKNIVAYQRTIQMLGHKNGCNSMPYLYLYLSVVVVYPKVGVTCMHYLYHLSVRVGGKLEQS